jgi:antitoxin VapB
MKNLLPSRKYVHVIAPTHGLIMPLNIRSEQVNRLAEKRAARMHINKTEAVKLTLENELRRLDEAVPLRERRRLLQRQVLARPATGLEANKAFYDDLSGDV